MTEPDKESLPPEPTDEWFDPDIACMGLTYSEKAGLQIYRNYTRSFEDHAIKRFVETLNLESLDLADLERLIRLVTGEDARFLPVIVCAFADDLLRTTFKAALPDGIPGGKENMFGGYGPLSDFAKRIQLAYAFNILSPDLMQELDRLRSARNAISHSWNIGDLGDFFTKGRLADMHRMEELLSDREGPMFSGGLSRWRRSGYDWSGLLDGSSMKLPPTTARRRQACGRKLHCIVSRALIGSGKYQSSVSKLRGKLRSQLRSFTPMWTWKNLAA